MNSLAYKLAIGLVAIGLVSTCPSAQPTTSDKHDQSKTLEQINSQLKEQGFYKAFPPAGIEVVSWYVMMGIGQVVTLRVPAERLGEVNRAIEMTAWGGYRTEFYPTYDYKKVAGDLRGKAQNQ